MSSNVEKFIIELGFKDDEVLKGFKKFIKEYETLNKKLVNKSRESKRKVTQQVKQQSKVEDEANKVLREQIRLRNAIRRAKELGMDTKSEEMSLIRAKKTNTILKRRIQLEDKISKVQLENTKNKRDTDSVDAVKQKQKAEEKAARDREKQQKAEAKRQEQMDRAKAARLKSYQKQLNSLYTSAKFQRYASSNPTGASGIMRQGDNFLNAVRNAPKTDRSDVDLDRQFKDFRSTVNQTTTAISRHSRAMVGLQTVQFGLRDSTRNLVRSYASLFAVLAGTSVINTVGQDFETMKASMLLASGTADQAAVDFKFVRDEVMRLGLDLKDATDGFVKLKFAASGKISDTDINKLFVGYNEFAKAIGVDKFRVEKGMQAIQQMMNKNQIMAEELKNQLAEQVPGKLLKTNKFFAPI